MAKKKLYLYAVQRSSGHEVVSAQVEGLTPAVEAQHMPNGLVRLVRDGEVIASGSAVVDNPDEELTLYRWDATDKTADPAKATKVDNAL